MSTYDVMKKYVASSVIDHTLSILAKDPQRNLVTLTRILELFAGGEKENSRFKWQERRLKIRITYGLNLRNEAFP